MAKFQIVETIHSEKVSTVRLGTNTIANSGGYTDKEVGKAVKLTAESRYALCAAGDPIQGVISSMNAGSFDGFSIGGIVATGLKSVTFDGLQADVGTGVIALGDFVVTGTVVAAGTALTAPLKVTKATVQPGVAIVSTVATADTAAAVKVALDAALALNAAAQKNLAHGWRVVSLGTAGTGAVGTTGVIERVTV